ncbi:hypothetical protein HDV06_000454 [Boothiomyces sp. JEL0866]|nr:hypothetical protein HDV06_000454 [Boothiomyces sp. JEL0866]
MKIAVIGGTGRTAIPVIRKAISENKVSALVRTQSKFPKDLLGHSNLNVVSGDIYNQNAIDKLLEGAEIVLIATGGPPIDPTSIVHDSVQALVNSPHKPKFVYLITSSGVGEDISQMPFIYRAIIHPVILQNNYQDLENAELALKHYCASNDCSYTIFRPPQIWDDSPNGDFDTYLVQEGGYSNQITYQDFATAIYNEIKTQAYPNKTVFVNSKTVLGSFVDPKTETRKALKLAVGRYIPPILLGLGIIIGGIYACTKYLK